MDVIPGPYALLLSRSETSMELRRDLNTNVFINSLNLTYNAIHHFQRWGQIGCAKEMDIVFLRRML